MLARWTKLERTFQEGELCGQNAEMENLKTQIQGIASRSVQLEYG